MVAVFAAALAAPAVRAAASDAPSFASVRSGYASSDAVLLDRHGVELARIRVDHAARRGAWTPLAAMSPQLAAALVDGEDRRFYGHHGVDWTGFAVVAVDNLVRSAEGRNARGASTLTMQLAAMLDPALGSGGQRSLGQKWDQVQAALRLERTWTKPQILEAYLNLATFRGELAGVRAASTQLFGKDPSGVDRDEAALLVALLRAPSATPGVVAQRACALLRDEARASGGDDMAVDCERARQLAMTRLNARTAVAPDALAPHLATRFAAHAGERIATTL
ncbi:MAG: transglycosylase domain-containing protein, partial [Proteobacteria bacterium]|nr:transglycosylase domain-containing protein [Pseudomonadota bacterium]